MLVGMYKVGENMIDKEFTSQITEFENGWIETPNGIFTPNDEQGLTAYEVYEKYLYNLNNPPIPQLTLEEKVQLQEDKINILKEENEKQDELIDTTLLATDEMYMMLEPLLASQVNLTSEYISRMAAMYVAMVQRGLKTIDEVPVRYREEVRAIIEN